MITTIGRELLKEAIPPAYIPAEPLTGKRLGEVFTRMAKELPPDEYTKVAKKASDLGREVTTLYGREASLSLADLKTPPEILEEREKLRGQIRKVINDPLMDSAAKKKRITEMSVKFADGLDKRLMAALAGKGNSFHAQIESGSRGNAGQLSQMLIGDVLVPDIKRGLNPLPALRGYGEGADPMSYWMAHPATRGGLVDVQFKTAESGHFSKQLGNIAHKLVVKGEDGGDPDQGLVVDGGDPDNIGSVLARPAAGLPAGHPITEDHLQLLNCTRIVVKSPMACSDPDGIPRMVAGVREKGDYPQDGDAVGLNAVKAFGEAVTQSSLKSKHSGASVKGAGLQGFEEINQMVQVPTEFVGGATLSRLDGTVGNVTKAPQGGWFVTVGSERHHIPTDREVVVKPGDKVEAGDILSDGTPNPAAIAGYKGIGEGRRYFLDKFRDILKKNNADSGRRNLELFARAFISKVRITDPDGHAGYLPDDVVDYERLASKWEPREGTTDEKLSTATGKYLEKPYLHYTIGTRVTPKVAKELNEFGHGVIKVHPAPPPFEPMVRRAEDFTRFDEDWVARLGGSYLETATLDAARRGATSKWAGPSYYPRVLGLSAENRPPEIDKTST